MRRYRRHLRGVLRLKNWVWITAASVLMGCFCGCQSPLDVLGPRDPEPQGPVPGVPAPDLLYRFDEGAGSRALDSSERGSLVHLTIEDPLATEWLTNGLRLRTGTRLSGEVAPILLVNAVGRTGELTIEAWVTPTETVVGGTRRIVSLSAGGNTRNFLLGQGDLFAAPAIDAFVFRYRGADANGLPMLSSGAGVAQARLTHLVAQHLEDGTERLFVDGALIAEGQREGVGLPWDPAFLLAVGDEHATVDTDRAWLGDLHLIAVYSTALPADAIRTLFARGPMDR